MNRLLLFLGLLAAVPAFGQWYSGGNAIQDETWRKTKGQFGVMLVLTDEPEKLVEDWEKPEIPNIKMTSVATRGKPIVAFILFTGCAESQGRCDSEIDFVVLKPDGSEYSSHSGAPLWKYPAPPGRALQLSTANLGIRIEPQDPVGTYRILAKARDTNAKLDIDVSQTFVVEK